MSLEINSSVTGYRVEGEGPTLLLLKRETLHATKENKKINFVLNQCATIPFFQKSQMVCVLYFHEEDFQEWFLQHALAKSAPVRLIIAHILVQF